MGIIEAVALGIIEGITEFLPISSTAHLTIAEKLFGHSIDSPDVTAFTAIIQVGAIIATLVYFRQDLWRIGRFWLVGLLRAKERTHHDYHFGWAVIIGSIPIGIAGLVFKDQIESDLRSLWIIGAALVVWSGVMWLADRSARQTRHEDDVTWKDTLLMGLVQCLALFPGVSRSGATLSAGLWRGLDRVTVTRLSFFLSIPALLAAGALQLATEHDRIGSGVGWPATITATIVSFIVAYAAVAWLLKFVAKHSFNVFILYRLGLGLLILGLLATGTLSAT